MTRIIAGFAGSLRLAVPAKGTRPTSDRVREAIFSALDARGTIDGARVLDLYAGSGSLGLEAASRGAVHVTLVEKAAPASAICKKNAALISARAPRQLRIEVAATGVRQYLASAREAADIVFIDPPYDLPDSELAQDLAALTLAPGAVVVVERSSRSPEPEWPAHLAPTRSKQYGDTTLWWAGAVE